MPTGCTPVAGREDLARVIPRPVSLAVARQEYLDGGRYQGQALRPCTFFEWVVWRHSLDKVAMRADGGGKVARTIRVCSVTRGSKKFEILVPMKIMSYPNISEVSYVC